MTIIIFAYSGQFIALPAYSELEHRTKEKFVKVSGAVYFVYMLVFLTVGICGIALFGSEIESDLMISLGLLPGALSFIGRLIFCFVLMCHIPYYLFASKEYVLVMYDELASRSMSLRLEEKLANLIPYFEDKQNTQTLPKQEDDAK